MITANKLIQETVKVINENPDFTYPEQNCSYLQENCPCVFGVVLSNLGFTQEELKAYENKSIYSLIWQSDKFAKECKAENVRSWADLIQQNQDLGDSWGSCLKVANETYSV